MRHFGIVFRYELKQLLLKRSTIITTAILVLVGFIGTSIPRISTWFSNGDTAPVTDKTFTEQVGYAFPSEALQEQMVQALGLQPENLYPSREAIVQALEDSALKVGFVFTGDTAYEAIYKDKGVDDNQDRAMAQFIASRHTDAELARKGLSQEELLQLQAFQPEATLTVMGKTTENNIMVAMILMIMVYMLVLLYGNITSVIIAREKDSKAMELLITSSKPAPLILGKVAAAGVSGVVQFGLVILAAFLGFYISRDFYPEAVRGMLMGSLSPTYLFHYLFFSITGYILYLFLYAALGSTVSRVEDVNGATAVVQFLFVAGYIATSSIMTNPNGPLAVITSIIPFTSIMVMPVRAGLATVPTAQTLLAAAIMLLTVALFAWLSIKIYRWGSLNYGNKTNLFKVIGQALRHERKPAR